MIERDRELMEAEIEYANIIEKINRRLDMQKPWILMRLPGARLDSELLAREAVARYRVAIHRLAAAAMSEGQE